MIKNKPLGNPMTQKETFDAFYTRKLEALAVELKSIVKGDIPYATSETYACRVCKGRIKVHCQGKIYCMKCCMPPELMPPMWSKELKRAVFRILQSYPSLEECHVEYEALQASCTQRVLKTEKQGDEELGRKIREAREKRGWTRADLAMQIKQDSGKFLSEKAIQGYETAHGKPSMHVLKKLEKLLGLEVAPDVQ